MKELSIFIDESGDLGSYTNHSPWYIVAMVFHEQESSIEEPLAYLEQELTFLGLKNHCIHTGPIIRKEEDYSEMGYLERRKIFNKMVTFIRQSKIRYKAIYIEKRKDDSAVDMTGRLSKKIALFIKEHYEYLISFDVVKIYYDNGQIELNKVISSLFNAFLARVEFRKVTPSDYRLFQVSDMICTFELISRKLTIEKLEKLSGGRILMLKNWKSRREKL